MPIEKTILETGQEPEYTIDDFGEVEYLKDGSVRIAVCSEWRGGLRTEYQVRIRISTLAELGRKCMQIAAEAHNVEESELILVAH